jgi:hypothetical protein
VDISDSDENYTTCGYCFTNYNDEEYLLITYSECEQRYRECTVTIEQAGLEDDEFYNIPFNYSKCMTGMYSNVLYRIIPDEDEIDYGYV